MQQKTVSITQYGTVFKNNKDEFWHPKLYKHRNGGKVKVSRTGKCVLVVKNGRLTEIIPTVQLMKVSDTSTRRQAEVLGIPDTSKKKVIADGWCLGIYSPYTPDEFLESVRSTTQPKYLDNSSFLKVSPKHEGKTVQILVVLHKGKKKYLAFIGGKQIHVKAKHPLRYSKWAPESPYAKTKLHF